MKFPRKTKRMPNGCVAFEKLTKGRFPKSTGKYNSKFRLPILYRGKRWKASRLSFHLNVKHISHTPKTLKRGLILHTCDMAWCVNPEHLYFGTSTQNRIDMYTRNLTVHQKLKKFWTLEKRKVKSELVKKHHIIGIHKYNWTIAARSKVSKSMTKIWQERREYQS